MQQGYGTEDEQPKTALDRMQQAYAQADSEVSTVCNKDTQLVNHIGGARTKRPEWWTAPPLASPSASNRLRGPVSSAKFGPWLEEQGSRLEVPSEYVADALGISVDALQSMTRGEVQWAATQRRKAEKALASYRANGAAP
jgi:hypothetical protein